MDRIENILKLLALKKIEFVIDNKIYKKGKVKIFNTKQFHIKFKLEKEEDTKEFELPYPYRTFFNDNNDVVFDYCLSAFVPPSEETFWRLKTISSSGSSKIHEKYLVLKEYTD